MRCAVLLLAGASACSSMAATPGVIEVPRADGRMTPVRVYETASNGGCPPLALISHGAGGTENAYTYLASELNSLGYRTLVMRHRESDRDAMQEDIRAERGLRAGVQALVADPVAEQSRLLDVGAALTWAEAQCHAPFKVLLGHSMGANTVMLEAGARDMIGIKEQLSGQNRFDAYVALSPEGPGLVFPEHAWRGVRSPILTMSGSRDQSLTGPAQTRQIPWSDLPGANQCQWQAVIDGATHMNFAGVGVGHAAVESEVERTIAAFLTGERAGHCVPPASNPRATFAAK